MVKNQNLESLIGTYNRSPYGGSLPQLWNLQSGAHHWTHDKLGSGGDDQA